MSARALLILVDLDNVQHRWRSSPAARAPERVFWVPGAAESGEPLATAGVLSAEPAWVNEPERPLRVVFGMNHHTVTSHAVTYGGLERFAERLAVKFRGALAEGGVELALMRTVPQAADVALFRLLREAPGEDGLGYDRVVVMSEDHGLVAAIGAELGFSRVWRRKCLYSSFRVPDRLHRRPSAPRASADLCPQAPVPGWGSRIERAAHVAWLESEPQHTSLDVCESLQDVARAIGFERPGLLSEISLTTTSVRGVARHRWTGDRPSSVRLGSVDCGDGLELHVPSFPAPDGRARVLRASSVPGAAWVEGMTTAHAEFRGSIPTGLPQSVLGRLEAPRCRIRGGAIVVGDLGWIRGFPCTVIFRSVRNQSGGTDLTWRVAHPPDRIPAAWLVRWRGRKTPPALVSAARLNHVPDRIAEAHVRAELVRDRLAPERWLLRCAHPPGRPLSPPLQPILPGHVGSVSDGRQGDVLILNVGQRPIEAGTAPEVWTTIDRLEPSVIGAAAGSSAWLREQATEVRLLPLAVVGASGR